MPHLPPPGSTTDIPILYALNKMPINVINKYALCIQYTSLYASIHTDQKNKNVFGTNLVLHQAYKIKNLN